MCVCVCVLETRGPSPGCPVYKALSDKSSPEGSHVEVRGIEYHLGSSISFSRFHSKAYDLQAIQFSHPKSSHDLDQPPISIECPSIQNPS